MSSRSTSTTTDRITEFVTSQFLPDVDASELAADYDLVDNGVIDSLGLIRVISWVSETFELPLDDIPIAAENFRSVEAIDRFVTEAKAPAAAL
ncbi:acyl carrier protein [Streptomyces spiramyceticus]|uniref:acyl carrier protein n=1 Tax=Streptomyces spiramyceticus TaxID=299717 RepID=UPI00237BB437|nr:acyl carrier protein [Streptomyces spiramyceticus]